MKIVVTHTSPDWDAIGSVWLIKKFLPGWQGASVEFVPAGQRKKGLESFSFAHPDLIGAQDKQDSQIINPIEKLDDDEVIHTDTGLGPLDHHQTSDDTVCATTLAWKYVQEQIKQAKEEFTSEHFEAVDRIVKVIVAIDHFKEVFWQEPIADYHEFSLLGVLEGVKFMRPNEDLHYMEFGIECLDALVHEFENRIWAEREIADNGIIFETKHGKGIAFETINDSVLKLAQKMGYMFVVRKDPRKGYIRIKVRPATSKTDDVSLELVYEQLKKMDPEATWFLHVSKKMLLNGTPKNPKMIPSKLRLEQIIAVLKNTY